MERLTRVAGSSAPTSALPSITDRRFNGGAAWDGVTNDNIKYQDAAKTGKKFYLPNGVGNITDISVGLFDQKFSILGDGAQIGSLQDPVDDYRASRTEIKYSKYRGASSGDPRWDTCAMYTLVKCPKGGIAPKGAGSALTGYIRAIGSEGGDHVGVHARSEGDTSFDIGDGMGAWGAWISAVYKPNTASAGKHMKTLIGCEIDVQNDGVSAERKNPTGVGELRGLVVGNTGTGHLNQGIDIVKHVAGSPGRWWSGMRVRANSIVDRSDVTTEAEVGECILLEGGVSSFERYGGIKFHKTPYTIPGQGGHFSYGIDFSEATFRLGNAITLAAGQRITWDPETSRGISVDVAGSNMININGYTIAVNGTKVLGTRVTGVFAPTGPNSGASFNTATVTLQQLAEYVAKLATAGISHGFWSPT